MSSRILPIALAGFFAAPICWAVIQPERTQQVVAGVVLVAVIVAVLLIDAALNLFHIANIKYLPLFGFAVFLAFGMVADTYTKSHTSNGYAIILAFTSVLLFLLGFEVSFAKRKWLQSRPQH